MLVDNGVGWWFVGNWGCLDCVGERLSLGAEGRAGVWTETARGN